MFLFNTTIMVEEPAHEEWLSWARAYLVPETMDSGCFVSSRLLRVVDSPNEGVTYCLQYVADNRGKIDEFLTRHDPQIQRTHIANFPNRFVSFSTIMEYID
ncbi:DUF4286 family protein [Hufsiella ginkgonis]|uniref:DUF4286 family protein n=1 Tax=Hufsiella ginkgonis TaxID=2695274 RepID=A0A7K1Y2V4_9SPHI|nr:DUF4286 family protein [Hufsiella ginkgonis]MXV17614.1 DUF4286 family protein [Hufsiella ginkgonis]